MAEFFLGFLTGISAGLIILAWIVAKTLNIIKTYAVPPSDLENK